MSTREQLHEVKREIVELEQEAANSAAEHDEAMREVAQDGEYRLRATREKLMREAELRELLCSWQASALQMMAEENASLTALLQGIPKLNLQSSLD